MGSSFCFTFQRLGGDDARTRVARGPHDDLSAFVQPSALELGSSERHHAYSTGDRALDTNAASAKAIPELKGAGVLPEEVEVRQVKSLNTLIEQDHWCIKRLTKPGMGFSSLKTAWRTLQGCEMMNMMRKGQIRGVDKGDVSGQIALVIMLFGVVAYAELQGNFMPSFFSSKFLQHNRYGGLYFVRIVIAFARIIVAASAQNRVQKRHSLSHKMSLHHLPSFSCSQNSETHHFVLSHHFIWQKMKPVYNRFQNDQRQELRQKSMVSGFPGWR
jgi:hypothetical protein